MTRLPKPTRAARTIWVRRSVACAPATGKRCWRSPTRRTTRPAFNPRAPRVTRATRLVRSGCDRRIAGELLFVRKAPQYSDPCAGRPHAAVSQCLVEGSGIGRAVEVQARQLPRMRLLLECGMDGAACSSPLRFGIDVEKPDLAAAVKQADAAQPAFVLCNHAAIFGIIQPRHEVLRRFVGQPCREGGWVIVMIRAA